MDVRLTDSKKDEDLMMEKNKTLIPTALADGTTPLTPEQIVETLRVLRQHVPDFGPLSVPEATALRTTAKIHPEFALASINTIGASATIAQAVDHDAPSLINERIEADRWSAVEDELLTMLKGVSAAILARRYRIGLASLQAYNIARQLVRKKENAGLLPHVENMRRTNRLGRKKAAAPTTPQTPASPTPAPSTTPAQPSATPSPVVPPKQQ